MRSCDFCGRTDVPNKAIKTQNSFRYYFNEDRPFVERRESSMCSNCKCRLHRPNKYIKNGNEYSLTEISGFLTEKDGLIIIN